MMNIFYICRLRRFSLRKKIEKERLQKSIRRHWPNDWIDLEFLVREGWRVSAQNKQRIYQYIVFVNKELDIDWIVADPALNKKTGNICHAAELESIPHKYLPKRQIIAFKMLIGEAIVAFLEGCDDNARQIIADAKKYVEDRSAECSKKWILEIATSWYILILTAAYFIEHAGFYEGKYGIYVIAALGSITGTYLSIVRNIGKDRFAASAGWKLHFLRVATQLLIGAILGAVSALILSSSLLCPPFFCDFQKTWQGFALFGFIAGFIDRFIPDIISVQYQRKESE